MPPPYGRTAAVAQAVVGGGISVVACFELALGDPFRAIAELLLGTSVLAKGLIENSGQGRNDDRLFGHVVAAVGFSILGAYLVGLGIYAGTSGGGAGEVRRDVGLGLLSGVLAWVLAKNSDPAWTRRRLEDALARTRRSATDDERS